MRVQISLKIFICAFIVDNCSYVKLHYRSGRKGFQAADLRGHSYAEFENGFR